MCMESVEPQKRACTDTVTHSVHKLHLFFEHNQCLSFQQFHGCDCCVSSIAKSMMQLNIVGLPLLPGSSILDASEVVPGHSEFQHSSTLTIHNKEIRPSGIPYNGGGMVAEGYSHALWSSRSA